MKLKAYKYQGAGNDFVIVDNRDGKLSFTSEQINWLCDRRFGIGGDGFMILGPSQKYDFSMRYFNADGPEGTMCGNGGRCLVAFAAHLGVKKFEFEAIDGYHIATVEDFTPHRCIVRLKMVDLKECKRFSPESFFLNTGSPHYVEFVKDLANYPVDEKGKYWRYYHEFVGGTNVNFVEPCKKKIKVRTYERGVEAETWACGTGVTASSICTWLQTRDHYSLAEKIDENTTHVKYDIEALGDKLAVEFDFNEKTGDFTNIFLTGPATFVFSTEIDMMK